MPEIKKYNVTRYSKVPEPNSVAEAALTQNSGSTDRNLISSAAHCSGLDLIHISLYLVAQDAPYEGNKLLYEFDPGDFSKLMGLKNDRDSFKKLTNYAMIFSSDLNFSIPTIDEKGNPTIVSIFEYIKFKKDSRTIEILFTRTGKKALVKEFQSSGKKIYYYLADELSMKSAYSKKLYPILLENINRKLMSFNGNGDLNGQYYSSIFNLPKFMDMMQIPPGYRRISSIKRICDSVASEITKCTHHDCAVEYNFIRSRGCSGKLTHICFRIAAKKKQNNQDDIVLDDLSFLDNSGADDAVIKSNTADIDADRLAWWMDLTGLDELSAKINLRKAAEFCRDDAFLKNAYEKCREQGAYNLGGLLTSMIVNGITDDKEISSAGCSKKNSFLNTPRSDMDYEKLAEQEEMDKVLHGFD